MVLVLATLALLGSRQSAANQVDAILARINKPREGDKDRIAALGEKAFVRIYPIVAKQLKGPDFGDQDKRGDASARRVIYLVACAGPSHTREMTALWARNRTYADWLLFSWLATKGEPRTNRSIFEKNLLASGNGRAQFAATALSRIGDDRSIQALANALEKSRPAGTYTRGQAIEDTRRQIVQCLGAIGKPSALDVVRKVLHRGRTVPKFPDRRALPESESDKEIFLSIANDSRGTRRALIEWDVLGGPTDLWVVRWEGGKWVDPIFTGRDLYWPRSVPGGTPIGEGFEKYEAEVKVLVEGQGWIKQFADNPDLSKDSDGDGFSDIVEKWIGTDPNKADTDGDGLPDGVDKNPLVGPHPMSDGECAMQAAMNFFTFDSTRLNVAQMIRIPAGVKPFEVESCAGMALFRPNERDIKPKGIKFGDWWTLSQPAKRLSDGSYKMELTQDGGYYWAQYEVVVKKLGTEWFCTSFRSTGYAIS